MNTTDGFEWTEASLGGFDEAQGLYKIDNLRAVDGILKSKYTLEITYKDGNLSYHYANLIQESDGRWKSVGRFLLYSPQKLYNDLTTSFNTIMNDPDLYTKAETEMLQNPSILVPMLATMNSIQRDSFIADKILNSTWTISGDMMDVRPNETGAYADHYKYRVILNFFVGGRMDTNRYYVRLFTNDDSFVSLSRGTEVSLTGEVVSFDVDLNDITVELADQRS